MTATMTPQERLFGHEASELLRTYVDEFLISDQDVLVHTCGWSLDVSGYSAWAIRGSVLRHLRAVHMTRVEKP